MAQRRPIQLWGLEKEAPVGTSVYIVTKKTAGLQNKPVNQGGEGDTEHAPL